MGITFQAFRGSSGAQIAFTILLATSIGDRVTQCTAHERGVANAVKVGQNHFFTIGPPVPELWLSPNLAVKEQNERVYKCDDSCNFFCDSCKFAFSQLDFMPRGMI